MPVPGIERDKLRATDARSPQGDGWGVVVTRQVSSRQEGPAANGLQRRLWKLWEVPHGSSMARSRDSLGWSEHRRTGPSGSSGLPEDGADRAIPKPDPGG